MSIKTWSKWHDAAKKEFHRGMLKVLSKFHIIIRPEILTKNSKLFFQTSLHHIKKRYESLSKTFPVRVYVFKFNYAQCEPDQCTKFIQSHQ